MDVTKDVAKDVANAVGAVDAAWQRAWNQVHTAVQRRVRVGKDVEPFELLALMEEVYVQMRDELHVKVEEDPPRVTARPLRDDDYGVGAAL